tara:strand:- start:711 stop:1748 length:1038 start_codon:yes stop_codon:yes gene_type:complete
MVKTTKVAADRAHDKTKTVLPAEVARGVYVENAPSAESLKLMHLLIGTAGGRMADDVRHEIRLAEVKAVKGMRNHSRATLRQLFIELKQAVLIFDDEETQCEVLGGFMDEIRIDHQHEVSDDLMITWYFGRTFRTMADQSCHWAIMDRQTVFALSSKYSIMLFQHISSLANLDYVTSKTFTVPELRAALGVAEGKLSAWNDVNKRALKPAIAEINQTSRLTLTATPRKIGRTVFSVEIAWEDKPLEGRKVARRELDRSKVGRKVRRDGTAETPVTAFPASGSVKDTQPWDRIAREHAPKLEGRHTPDLRQLADAFRKWCDGKSINLDASSIEKSFTTWCKSYSAR